MSDREPAAPAVTDQRRGEGTGESPTVRPDDRPLSADSTLARDVAVRARRKRRRSRTPSVWFSLGLMGLVGWTIAIPTLLGVAAGAWLDYTWPGRVSWTLTLLLAGVALGCMNAWRWIRQESNPTDAPDEPGDADARRHPKDADGDGA
ncbi:MAG: AtpZ/AtpI family protein [Gammaproteobacteria bacterium]|nr:AtpZ/AtpI family protein [Gammaproteobacteria bacterium]